MLAIETSQRSGGVALRDRAGTVYEELIESGRGHADQLLPTIDRVVSNAGLTPRDLEWIAVSIGPGGFTGLRVATATVKMIAEVTAARVIGVPSALVAAYGTDLTGRILVALASKGETFWATAMERASKNDAWQMIPAEVVGWRENPQLLPASDFDPAPYNGVLADAYLPAEARRRCEAASCSLIEPRFTAGQCLRASDFLLSQFDESPLSLLPIYPRPPEAVTLWQQHQKSRRS